MTYTDSPTGGSPSRPPRRRTALLVAAFAAALALLVVGLGAGTVGAGPADAGATLDSSALQTGTNGTIAVVDDENATQGTAWADELDGRLDNYTVEHITSGDVLGSGGSIDDYDAYFVHRLDGSNTGAWFNATADVPAVYTQGYSSPTEPSSLQKRSNEIGDPDSVYSQGWANTWTVDVAHPIFDGVAQPGDTIDVFSNPGINAGAEFTGTDAEVVATVNDSIAAADDSNDAVAVDDSRQDVLLTALGSVVDRGVDEHTDDAIEVLANSLTYYLERSEGTVGGQVTDTGGTGVANATVNVTGQLAETTTNATGYYELGVPPGESTLELSAFGYDGESGTVNVTAGETVERDFSLADRVDATVLDGQQAEIEGGGTIQVTLDAVNVDTVTVENNGTLTTGLNLSVDGTDAAFGESVSIDDGQVAITVETAPKTAGTVELESTVAGAGSDRTVSTGPTGVFEGFIAVVDDDDASNGAAWAAELDAELGETYAVESVTSDEVLGNGSIDDYDAYFAHGFDPGETNESAWYNATADVPTVYTDQYLGPATLADRSFAIGDPAGVRSGPDLATWTIDAAHPILDGVADPGDAIQVHTGGSGYGSSFGETSAEVIASARNGANAIAVDRDREDVLLTAVGSSVYVGVSTHTDDAIDVLANSLTYFIDPTEGTVEGQVTDATGDPIPNATVTLADELPEVTTNATGHYEFAFRPGEYTVEVSAFGFEGDSAAVNVTDGGTVEQDFTLPDALAVDLAEDQPRGVVAGDEVEVLFDVANADTVTVENAGNLTAGLNLSIDGTDAAFGENVSIDDGRLDVTVNTTANTSGTVELEATFDGTGETATVTTGPTDVFVTAQTIGVVEDVLPSDGTAWAAELDAELGGTYVVEWVTSDEVLGPNGSIDDFDAYFVHGLNETNEAAWFNATDGVPTVYTAMEFGPRTLDQRNRTIGDPSTVTLDDDLATWTIDTAHPIFDGVAGPGDELLVHDNVLEDGASFAGTSAEVLASAADGDDAVAVDDGREDVLLTAIGESGIIQVEDHTDGAIEVLGNSLTYYLEGVSGTVTDTSGTPIGGASVDVVGEDAQAVTDANGHYELGLDPGEHVIEVSADGHDGVAMSMTIQDDEMLEHQVALAPAHDVGDVEQTGELSIVDAVLIQQHLAELDPEPFDPAIADVQRTGEVTIVDAVLIQQYLAEIRDAGSADVVDVGAPTSVAADDSVDVTVTIENTGGLGVLQNVEHRFAAEESDLDEYATVAVDVVDLAPGADGEMTATIDTAGLSPGTYHYEVVTDDDSQTVTIDVGGGSTGEATSRRGRAPDALAEHAGV
jgi:hypothetical protein